MNRDSSPQDLYYTYNDFGGGGGGGGGSLWQKASRNWAAAVGGSKMVDCSI